MLTRTPNIAAIMGPTPKIVARGAKNLGNMLIQSEFVKEPSASWLLTYPRAKGMFPSSRW